jgi:hypothetical protein
MADSPHPIRDLLHGLAVACPTAPWVGHFVFLLAPQNREAEPLHAETDLRRSLR